MARDVTPPPSVLARQDHKARDRQLTAFDVPVEEVDRETAEGRDRFLNRRVEVVARVAQRGLPEPDFARGDVQIALLLGEPGRVRRGVAPPVACRSERVPSDAARRFGFDLVPDEAGDTRARVTKLDREPAGSIHTPSLARSRGVTGGAPAQGKPVGETARAKLRRMDSERPRHVTLTGDLAGDYVVVEEREDGSVVVAPDPSRRSQAPRRRPAPRETSSLLSGLLSRPPTEPPNVPELLEEWGVELGEGEVSRDFLIADIDGTTGFLAITSERFIFATRTGKELGVVQEHLLSAARNVELVGRRRRPKLRVIWHGSESVIGLLDRDAIERLQEYLAAHRIS